MEILTLNIKTLKFFQLWPKENLSWAGNILVIFVHLFIISMSATQTFAAIIYQFYVRFENTSMISESVIGVCDFFGFLFIYVCFRRNYGLVKESMKESTKFLKYCTPKVMEVAEKEVQTYTKGLIVYCSCGITINALIPLYDYDNCEKRRLSDYYRAHDPCGMPITTWIPFDVRTSVFYYLVFLLHANSCLNVCGGVLSISMTLVGFLIHIIAQIKHLRQNLLEVFDEVPEDTSCESKTLDLKLEAKLEFCVKYHIRIIDYTNQVFAAFSVMLVVHVFLTSLIFAMLGYQIVLVEDFTEKLRYTLHLGGWVTLLFLICYYGQLILDESTTVANAAYQSKWYNGPSTMRKNLCLIIMRSQKPLIMTTASIGVISLETFVWVIKTAYSYFALLLSIAE